MQILGRRKTGIENAIAAAETGRTGREGTRTQGGTGNAKGTGRGIGIVDIALTVTQVVKTNLKK